MDTKTIARIRMTDGARFIVDRQITRRHHGGRKATGHLYQYTGEGRQKLETFKARLTDTDQTIENALDAISFYTTADVDDITHPN